jgi:predicted ATPase
MKINKITIQGYKNIQSITMELSPITAIIGVNNFGKTNLLKGIDFASRFLHSSPDERPDLMQDEKNIPINVKNAGSNFLFCMEGLFEGEYFEYLFECSWHTPSSPARIVRETLRMRSKTSDRYLKFINRTKDTALYKSTREGRCQKQIHILSPQTLVIEYLLETQLDLFFTSILTALKSFTVDYNRLTDSRIEPQPPFMQPVSRQKAFSLHAGHGASLLTVLKNVRETYPDKYHLWENTVKALIPTIQDISFLVENKQLPIESIHLPRSSVAENYHLMIQEKNLTRPVDLFRLSSGVRRVLLLLLNIILVDVNHFSIIEFEELESSVSPLMLQRLLMAISSICEDCRVIVTTHSPSLVNFISLDSVYIGISNEDSLAEFGRIKPTLRASAVRTADEMGVGIGDFLFNMLLSDNSCGLSSIREWIE